MRTLPHLAAATVLALLTTTGCGGASSSSTAGDTDTTATDLEAEAKLPNDLPPAQAKVVLKLIDDACGDSWCEGDNNFGFRTMKCQFKPQTCTLTMQIFTPEYTGHPKATYWRSCKMTQIPSFEAMVSTAANGWQSLDQDFYFKVDTCITTLESKLP